jgi:hypothetical protein
MEKMMRNSPSIIVFVVLLLQTPRVSDFGERIGVWLPLAIIFALFLSFSTFTLSYFQARTQNYVVTADKETEKRAYNAQVKMAELFKEVYSTATIWLIIFVLIEGALNLAETMSHLEETVKQFDWEWFGAIVYGAFPTLAAYGMGNLQALVDKIPHGAGGASQLEKLFNAWMRRITNALDAQSDNANASATHETHDAKKGKRNANAYPKACPHCGEPQPNSNAYSAHMRWKHNPQASNQIGFNPQPVNQSTTTTAESTAKTPVKAK